MTTEAPIAPERYAFEDVLVDARAHRVTKDGQELQLEPKAYAVLLELLRAPGAAITRDALLDAVWGHRHVTPAVLNRIIAMLRRALGDDADHPRLIRTVHGTGYSFIAPLTAQPVPASRSSVQHAVASGAPSSVGEHREDPVDVPPERASPATGRLRAGSILALVVVVVVAVTWIFAYYTRPAAESGPADPTTATGAPAAPAVATARSIALLPPDLEGRDARDRALAFAYLDALHDALSRFPGLHLTGSESARVAILREQQPARAGQLLGVEHVLQATFSPSAERVLLDLALVRVSDHRRVWAHRFDEPRDQLFRTIAPTLDAVERVVAVARLPDPVLRAPVSAQDLFWRGVVELQLHEPGSPQRAIALFEQALAVDPSFASAWVGIAQAWRTAVWKREASIEEAAAKGRVAIARALEIDPELVSAHIGEALLLTMQWRTNEAAIPVRRARAIAPDNPGVLYLSANIATYEGRPNDAIPLRERLARLDPLSPVLYGLWARDLAAAGQLDAALAKHAEGVAIGPDSEYAIDGGVRILASYGRFAEAVQRFRAAKPEHASHIYSRLAMIAMLTALGDHAEAQRVLDATPAKTPEPPGHADTAIMLAWARGQRAEALAWIEGEGRATVQEPWRSVLRAHALALAGRREDALATYREVFADAGNRDLLATSVYALHLGLGEIANWAALEQAAGGDPSVALADIDARIDTMTKGGFAMPILDYYRAVRAQLAGDANAADAALGRAIAQGWRDRVALDVDLAWNGASGAWWDRRRAELAAALEAERARITPPTS